jgi:aspartyl-tRNA(Asn)/glutamyl-tRNA(Gln) amidotransferase subunit C
MAIDKDTARRVAHLARIEVAEADLEPLAAGLSAILGFMEQLREVGVEGVEPMTSVTPMTLKLRADAVTAGGDREAILRNAPAAADGFFTVPKVVE